MTFVFFGVFFTDSTIVSHHEKPPFGEDVVFFKPPQANPSLGGVCVWVFVGNSHLFMCLYISIYKFASK